MTGRFPTADRGSKSDLLVYQMRLRSAPRLYSAFALVSDCRKVASCSVEPERMRLRFLAVPAAAEELVERIYAEGGLTWCSRHALDSPG